MIDIKIIKSPTKGTREIINRRRGSKENLGNYDAVGLIQGKLIEMISAADIAEKSSDVIVEELRGSCPQNIISIAIFGDTSSVENAIENIVENDKGK